MLKKGKVVKHEDLSEFDKHQTVVARWLGQIISKSAALVRSS